MLDSIISNAIMLCVLTLTFCMLTVILQSVIRLVIKMKSLMQCQLSAQVLRCHYIECPNAGWYYVKYTNALCVDAEILYSDCHSVKCHKV
jgi:hypothetical protein